MALLTCDGAVLGYEGRAVLSGVSFSVNRGDYLCIVGENGSGKTTLMRTVLGLQKPLSGRIDFGDGLTRAGIGYLPQQTEFQRDFPATVREIVLSGCLPRCGRRPFYTKKEKETARACMEKMRLSALASRCYRELSGGQQQRVLLARALCASRQMLVLDEPVAGLDPKATGEMYACIRAMNREDGITILMISHDIEAAVREATHILHVGGKPFFGTKDAYLKSPFAGRPETAEGGDAT